MEITKSQAIWVFFLMIRRPPRSTLLPTRRSSDLGGASPTARRLTVPFLKGAEPWENESAPACRSAARCSRPWRASRCPGYDRSEEHTSELQSRQYLVCRLLLEKKKKITIHYHLYN